MEIALLIITLLALAGLGAFFALALPRMLAGHGAAERERTLAEIEESRFRHEQALENRLLEAQSRIADQQAQTFLKLATPQLKQVGEANQQALKDRQGEIDKGLDVLRKELENVRQFVTKTDTERVRSIGEVATMVKESRVATEALRQDTAKLNEALSGGQSRGQWGERVADDVLRVAGFIEGVNYRRQHTTADGSRPDFTFLLPDDRILHMDVKMPMAAFKRYLDAPTDGERDTAAKEFVRDAKHRIKEVTTRDYINPDEGTLDYTLVFIPNEQVYGFIHERDPEIVDFALRQHVVICSPLTLFAVLAVIRQSIENFRLESRTRDIQTAIVKFRRQWDMFKDQMDKVDRSVRSVDERWSELKTKRVNQLDKHIEKVDSLRSGNDGLESSGDRQGELPAAIDTADELFAIAKPADEGAPIARRGNEANDPADQYEVESSADSPDVLV
ncbi:MAG: DNA recombination protein RmuC [Actinobacteria bacterium]|nr:DNA recombination protein RmuC [Actinomycetota bacterium]